MGCSGFSLRTLTAQKRLVELFFRVPLASSSHLQTMGFLGHELFSLQPLHPICTEEVGLNLTSPQSGLPQPSWNYRFFRLQNPHPCSTEKIGLEQISLQRIMNTHNVFLSEQS